MVRVLQMLYLFRKPLQILLTSLQFNKLPQMSTYADQSMQVTL